MEEESNDNNQKEGRQNNDDGNPASTKRLKKTNDSITGTTDSNQKGDIDSIDDDCKPAPSTTIRLKETDEFIARISACDGDEIITNMDEVVTEMENQASDKSLE